MHSCVIGYVLALNVLYQSAKKVLQWKNLKSCLKSLDQSCFHLGIKNITKMKKILVLSMLNSTNKLCLGNFLFVWQLSSWSSFSTFLNTTFLNKNSTTMSLVKNLLNLVYNSTHVQTILDELEISSALGIMSPPSTTNTSSVTLP